MSDLEQIEKERMKKYKQYLKKQIEQKTDKSKKQKSSNLQRQNQQISQYVRRVSAEDYQKKKQRKQFAQTLNDDNLRLSMIKSYEHSTAIPYENPQKAFTSQISDQDIKRIIQNKKTLYNQSYINHQQQTGRKMHESIAKEQQKIRQYNHLNRQRELDRQRYQNYKNMLRKHSQNMNFFEKQRQLTDEEIKYRNSLIESFQNKEEIFAKVKRNQQAFRRERNKQVQQQLKKQIQQFDHRKKVQKQDINHPDDMAKSMLSSVLMRSPYRNPFYSNQLKSQMSQRQLKDMEEQKNRKQKIQLNNIYGGRPTAERYKQLNYVDKKLGIRNTGQEPIPPHLMKSRDLSKQRYYQSQILGGFSERLNRSMDDRNITKEKQQKNFLSKNPEPQISLPQVKPDTGNKKTFMSYNFINGSKQIYQT